MTEVRTCIRGCARRGQHLITCEGECAGCEPRTADYGDLCMPCHGRLARALTLAPALVEHIRAHVVPSGGATDNEQIKHTKAAAPPAPARVDAIDDADHIHALLTSWVVLHCEEGGFAGPRMRGSWHIPAGVSGIKPGWRPTGEAAAWLLTHLEWACDQPWIEDYYAAVCQGDKEIGMPGVFPLLARWPEAERSRHLPTECIECRRRSVVYHPPTVPGASVLIQCEHAECGYVLPQEAWAWYGRLTEASKREQRQKLRPSA